MTEREHVDQFWPHEDYAIVRKPRAAKPRGQQRSPRVAGALTSPRIIS